MTCTHLSVQITLSQYAHKESVVYSKSANYWDYVYNYYDCVCIHDCIIVHAKLKFPFRIRKTLVVLSVM